MAPAIPKAASSVLRQRSVRGAPGNLSASSRPNVQAMMSMAVPGGMSNGMGWRTPKCAGSA
eukprot:scaffold157401_cov28-Tisochrysis_lutea.AAC.3